MKTWSATAATQCGCASRKPERLGLQLERRSNLACACTLIHEPSAGKIFYRDPKRIENGDIGRVLTTRCAPREDIAQQREGRLGRKLSLAGCKNDIAALVNAALN